MGTKLCETKYPLMLIHGIGYDDYGRQSYWGRIPGVLRENGGAVYFGYQDPFGSISHNSEQIAQRIEVVRKKTGKDKVNLIAHSKGGLEARYVVSQLDMGEKVASITTLATPHRGIITLDKLQSKRQRGLRHLLHLFNTMLKIDGGERPTDNRIYNQLTADYMEVFNALVKDVPGIYYQSYAFDMKNSKSDPAMGIFHRIIGKLEGPNDGLVSVESAKWGDFRGVFPGSGEIGISHP
ncbi:MAG: alpha/beta fold hydrolase, partial [Anaerovoracaceae bacterium]